MANSISSIFDALDVSRMSEYTRENAPALVKWVEEISVRFGLKQSPLVIHVAHDLPQAYAGDLIFVNGGRRKFVAVTEGALQRVFKGADLAKEVPEGLKFIIGHEIGHAAEGPLMQSRRFPMFAMPALSLVGYELYREAGKRHENDPSKNMLQHLDAVTEEEKLKLPEKKHQYNFFDATNLEWASRLAVLGGGLVIGGALSRKMAFMSEFAADRAGVTACGNPQAAIDTLDSLQKHMTDYAGPRVEAWAQDLKRRSFMEKMSALYDVAKKVIIDSTYNSHPAYADRFAAMREFGIQQGMYPPLA